MDFDLDRDLSGIPDDQIIWYWVCLSEQDISRPYPTQEEAEDSSREFRDPNGFCTFYNNHHAFHRILSSRASHYRKGMEIRDSIANSYSTHNKFFPDEVTADDYYPETEREDRIDNDSHSHSF